MKKRFQKLGVSKQAYQLDTIASWCLRYTIGYPKTSELGAENPKNNREWAKVYPAAVKLTIAADGDPVGRAAAQQLATRADALGWHVSLLPAPEGRDWNDVLRGGELRA